MEKNIYYKEISKYLKKNFLKNKSMNILELGCGNKIYKKDASNHQYEGLDLPDSIWLDSKNKPEILSKLSNFNFFLLGNFKDISCNTKEIN